MCDVRLSLECCWWPFLLVLLLQQHTEALIWCTAGAGGIVSSVTITFGLWSWECFLHISLILLNTFTLGENYLNATQEAAESNWKNPICLLDFLIICTPMVWEVKIKPRPSMWSNETLWCWTCVPSSQGLSPAHEAWRRFIVSLVDFHVFTTQANLSPPFT